MPTAPTRYRHGARLCCPSTAPLTGPPNPCRTRCGSRHNGSDPTGKSDSPAGPEPGFRTPPRGGDPGKVRERDGEGPANLALGVLWMML
ncbi:hypothetical protein GCM10009759_21620 [Kitasatospora saccharophila]|uniref:Uncharacterized protein n=1 Tax=Kitasatospora saccharophila TaxID=407973 RepID=A0ABP5I8D5_9ACTN